MPNELTQVAWEAFPSGWFHEAGNLTMCGARLVRFSRGAVWALPPMDGKGARLVPADAGTADPDVARLLASLALLPDVTDPATAAMVRDMLCRRTGMDPSRGVTWAPRANGKAHGGWTIATPTQSRVFSAAAVPDRDSDIAMLRAVAATNCRCGTGTRTMCPMHGAKGVKPWR